MTADHSRPLLDVSADSLAALGQVAALFSRAQVSLEIVDVLDAGRLTALKKPDGGVRARTIAQQYPKRVVVATAPFQYALKTKSGCDTVAHIYKFSRSWTHSQGSDRVRPIPPQAKPL